MPAAALALALADPPLTEPVLSPAATVVPLPKKRGPNTPEGKARSRQNALKHGLRAKLLRLPPAGDDKAHFQELAAGLRRTYRPEDAAEAQLVEAIAVAMWQEITADRLEAETLVAMAGGDGEPFHGGLLLEAPANRAALHTVLRYQATASCAVGRAMRLFFQHRRAKRDGLLLVPDEAERTNDLPPLPEATPANDDASAPEPAPAASAAAESAAARPGRTNEPTGFRHDMPPLDPRDLLPAGSLPPAPPTRAPRKCTNDLLGSASASALTPGFGSPALWGTAGPPATASAS
jgi:hypothetical protein